MKLELIIIAITTFLIYNTYHNGKYTKMIFAYKKYYQMIFLGLLGISLWLVIKRDPKQCKNILLCANNMVKYMPIDKSSMNMISPIIDFTDGGGGGGFMNGLNCVFGTSTSSSSSSSSSEESNYEQRMMTRPHRQYQHQNHNSGGGNGEKPKATKRSVSETKKKYVASMQNWKCGKCNSQLTAWFEVDHKVRLEYGGGNEVENLVALCRECHGRKTAMENM